MKLRYTGPFTVTFHTAGVGEVEPGAEFTVPDEIADSFTARNDVEVVMEPVKPVGRKKSAPVQDAEPEPVPEAVEATSPVDQTEDSSDN